MTLIIIMHTCPLPYMPISCSLGVIITQGYLWLKLLTDILVRSNWLDRWIECTVSTVNPSKWHPHFSVSVGQYTLGSVHGMLLLAHQLAASLKLNAIITALMHQCAIFMLLYGITNISGEYACHGMLSVPTVVDGQTFRTCMQIKIGLTLPTFVLIHVVRTCKMCWWAKLNEWTDK